MCIYIGVIKVGDLGVDYFTIGPSGKKLLAYTYEKSEMRF